MCYYFLMWLFTFIRNGTFKMNKNRIQTAKRAQRDRIIYESLTENSVWIYFPFLSVGWVAEATENPRSTKWLGGPSIQLTRKWPQRIAVSAIINSVSKVDANAATTAHPTVHEIMSESFIHFRGIFSDCPQWRLLHFAPILLSNSLY